jgi:hypothetical protein
MYTYVTYIGQSLYVLSLSLLCVRTMWGGGNRKAPISAVFSDLSPLFYNNRQSIVDNGISEREMKV